MEQEVKREEVDVLLHPGVGPEESCEGLGVILPGARELDLLGWIAMAVVIIQVDRLVVVQDGHRTTFLVVDTSKVDGTLVVTDAPRVEHVPISPARVVIPFVTQVEGGVSPIVCSVEAVELAGNAARTA